MRALARAAAVSVVGLALCTAVAGEAEAGARARGAGRTIRALNYDLEGAQGAGGALRGVAYESLTALLMYLAPDLVALHNVAVAERGEAGSETARALALSLGMYSVSHPTMPGGRTGSALLSRYPIRASTRLSGGPAGGGVGAFTAEVEIEGRRLSLLVARPPSAAAATATIGEVTRLASAGPEERWLVFVSFAPEAKAAAALESWRAVGLVDPAAALGVRAVATFPRPRPEQRLDFVLASAGLTLRGYRVVDDPRLRHLGTRLPVELRLAL